VNSRYSATTRDIPAMSDWALNMVRVNAASLENEKVSSTSHWKE
jgi:hypothetical protein